MTLNYPLNHLCSNTGHRITCGSLPYLLLVVIFSFHLDPIPMLILINLTWFQFDSCGPLFRSTLMNLSYPIFNWSTLTRSQSRYKVMMYLTRVMYIKGQKKYRFINSINYFWPPWLVYTLFDNPRPKNSVIIKMKRGNMVSGSRTNIFFYFTLERTTILKIP